MKRFLLACSIALLFSSTASFAAPRDGGQGGHGHGNRNAGPERRLDDRGHHDNGRHLGHYKQAFRRGDRVPVVYLQPRYYVEDYRVYHLAPPPRGYRWVRPDDGRFLLVAVTTGVIAQILGY
jgi:Ni/Co efflux regulator RcnB